LNVSQLDSTLTPVIASGSTNSGNTQVVATIAAATNVLNYLEGFDISGTGATGAAAIELSIAGLAGGTIKVEAFVLAGATAPGWNNNVFSYRFPTPIPASGTNTAISVTVPALGAGNTNVSVTAYGLQKRLG
jgi:hypothetical protein